MGGDGWTGGQHVNRRREGEGRVGVAACYRRSSLLPQSRNHSKKKQRNIPGAAGSELLEEEEGGGGANGGAWKSTGRTGGGRMCERTGSAEANTEEGAGLVAETSKHVFAWISLTPPLPPTPWDQQSPRGLEFWNCPSDDDFISIHHSQVTRVQKDWEHWEQWGREGLKHTETDWTLVLIHPPSANSPVVNQMFQGEEERVQEMSAAP